MFETAFRQSMLYGDPFILFKRPISMVLLIVALFLIISPIFSGIAQRRKRLIDEENG
jgi:TctA family transporter